VNLVDRQGRYCGIGGEEGCRACGAAEVGRWRERSRQLLAGALRVVAPSQDLADRIRPYFPEARLEVREPESETAWPAPAQPELRAAEPLHLAVIGALNLAKGYEVVAGLARLIAREHAPIRITVIGPSADDARLRRRGVAVTGRYREAELDGLLRSQAPHFAFLPAIWPETWSFVLSAALRRGLPVLAFDHGAIGQRLRRLGRGTLLPPDLGRDPEALLRRLLLLRERHLSVAVRPC
jgi:glycosyltransferase involved in cell wall biosynthesis